MYPFRILTSLVVFVNKYDVAISKSGSKQRSHHINLKNVKHNFSYSSSLYVSCGWRFFALGFAIRTTSNKVDCGQKN